MLCNYICMVSYCEAKCKYMIENCGVAFVDNTTQSCTEILEMVSPSLVNTKLVERSYKRISMTTGMVDATLEGNLMRPNKRNIYGCLNVQCVEPCFEYDQDLKKKKTEKTRNFFSMEEEVTDASFCQHVFNVI